MSLKFFRCSVCGKIVEEVAGTQVPTICCGKDMILLEANTTDATLEKHVPEVVTKGSTVTVTIGSTLHPMTADHFIQFIAIETDKGVQMRYLKPGDKPEAVFTLNGEKLIAAYEYCNLHGLWCYNCNQKSPMLCNR